MADRQRSDFFVVFTMILWALEKLEILVTLLSEHIWVLNQKSVLSEAIWS